MIGPAAVALLFHLSAGQTADVALVPVVRDSALPADRAAQVAAQVGQVLRAEGLVVVPEPPAKPRSLELRMGGRVPNESVAYAGALQDATIALRLEGAELGEEMAIELEAFDARTSKLIARHTFGAKRSEDPSSWTGRLAPFTRKLKAYAAQHPLALAEPAPTVAGAPPSAPAEPVQAVAADPPGAKALASPSRPWLIPLAAGAVALGGGTFALVQAHVRYDALTGPGPRLAPDAARALALEGQSLQSWGLAGVLLGAGAVASGVGWWALTSFGAEPAPGLSVSAGPAGVHLRGAF